MDKILNIYLHGEDRDAESGMHLKYTRRGFRRINRFVRKESVYLQYTRPVGKLEEIFINLIEGIRRFFKPRPTEKIISDKVRRMLKRGVPVEMVEETINAYLDSLGDDALDDHTPDIEGFIVDSVITLDDYFRISGKLN